ncbi:MAG: hypothetical protein K0R55_4331, partial [Sporomusa sp.]|nr:hypothetical protein [Sporomusa sp.]
MWLVLPMALACLMGRGKMCTYTETYKGLDAVALENETIKIVVLPQLGAKIASLLYKPQNFEVFFQPTEGIFRLSRHGEPFADYDTAGADEMYPTIDACIYTYDGYGGKSLPDHGDLW